MERAKGGVPGLGAAVGSRLRRRCRRQEIQGLRTNGKDPSGGGAAVGLAVRCWSWGWELGVGNGGEEQGTALIGVVEGDEGVR